MRLIDEAEVIKRMHETMDYQDLYLPIHFEMCMRDVDAVEVVRCKDCKYFYEKQEECPFKWKDLLNDNDFCSYGERNEINSR